MANSPATRNQPQANSHSAFSAFELVKIRVFRVKGSAPSRFSLPLLRRFNSGVANLHIQPVQSLDAPELALYCTLRRVEEHERAGVLVATNAKVVRRLLASRYTVVSALLTPAWLEKLEPLLRARPEDICVYVGERKLLETITGYQLHQGALAVAKIPPQPDFETLLNKFPASDAARRRGGHRQRGKSRRGGPELRGFWRAFSDCGRDVWQSVPTPRGFRFHGRHLRATAGAGGQPGGKTDGACGRGACGVWRRIPGPGRRSWPPWICGAIAAWCLARKDRA